MSIESELAKNVQSATTMPLRWKVFAVLTVVLILSIAAAGFYFMWQHNVKVEEKLQQAVVMTAEQAKNINVLENKLQVNQQNAELLAVAIAKAQSGQIQPVTHFTVQAPTLPQAAVQVQERINKQDPTLPPVALEKTDRTVVVQNDKKTPQANWDVGVFKVNNYRNWEWSVGYGRHGSDNYIPVELQRNFSKDAAVSYEQHVGGKEEGFEVKYSRKTDKLLFLF